MTTSEYGGVQKATEQLINLHTGPQPSPFKITRELGGLSTGGQVLISAADNSPAVSDTSGAANTNTEQRNSSKVSRLLRAIARATINPIRHAA